MARHKATSSLGPESKFSSSPEALFSPVNVGSATALRATLALSSSASLQQLVHSSTLLSPTYRPTPLISPKIFKTYSDPEVAELLRKHKNTPSDYDYQHLLSRLDKAISSSSAARRYCILTDDLPLNLSLETEEWQLVRVPLEGRKTPMQVTIQRIKGKVICYLGRNQDPTEHFYDEICSKDTVEVTEIGTHFRLKWLGIGFKSLSEADLSLSVKFGPLPHRRPKPLVRTQVLADLDELRKDENKRQTLFDKVEFLLAQRAEARRSANNYVLQNILDAGRQRDEVWERRETEKARREQVIERYREGLREKKSRVAMLKQQKQQRLEARAKAQAEQEVQLQTQTEQQTWLALSCLAGASLAWLQELQNRKEKIQEMSRKMGAAMILQRCYRKVLLTINPKRLVRQHAIEHLCLFSGLLGPEAAYNSRTKLLVCIVDSCKANAIGVYIIRFLARGKDYTVRLIQRQWWKYKEKQALRMARLSLLWDVAIKEMTASIKVKKKAKRRAKEPDPHVLDRTEPLAIYMFKCQQRYYADLRASRAARPHFRYLPSTEEMKDLIKESGWFQ